MAEGEDKGPRNRASDMPMDLRKERESFVRTYLKRGVELTEELLGENEELRGEIAKYFAGPNTAIDEGDLDFSTLDELIFYVLEQPHPDYVDDFEVAAPASPPREFDPDLEIDRTDQALATSMDAGAADMQWQDRPYHVLARSVCDTK